MPLVTRIHEVYSLPESSQGLQRSQKPKKMKNQWVKKKRVITRTGWPSAVS